MTLFTVHRVHPKARCFMTGKETQAVEFSTADGARVIVALKEFQELLRLELEKAETVSHQRAPRSSTAGDRP